MDNRVKFIKHRGNSVSFTKALTEKGESYLGACSRAVAKTWSFTESKQSLNKQSHPSTHVIFVRNHIGMCSTGINYITRVTKSIMFGPVQPHSKSIHKQSIRPIPSMCGFVFSLVWFSLPNKGTFYSCSTTLSSTNGVRYRV